MQGNEGFDKRISMNDIKNAFKEEFITIVEKYVNSHFSLTL
jgi:hypothetical protein